MKRLNLVTSTTAADDEPSRGADASDLARLRERADGLQEARAAEARNIELAEHLRATRDAEIEREAQRIDAIARAIEADNQTRWMRLLTHLSVAGLGSFVAMQLLTRPSTPRGESR